MDKFDKEIERLMEMLAGDVFGDTGAGHGGDFGNTDWYAPDDARIPKVIGAKKKGKKKKTKSKKKSGAIEVEIEEIVPMQRRVFPNS